MSVDSIGIILRLGAFVVLVVLRVPLEAIAQKMADGVMNFSLLAIPFFIIMGEIMNEGGGSPSASSTWPTASWAGCREGSHLST